MTKKIAIIDYSLGNLFSVQQAFKQCEAETFVTDDPNEILTADALVLPGVGAFAEAMDKLTHYKLDIAIKDSINQGKPFLGICLGMQLLFSQSEEFGATNGLGIIEGEIKKFKTINPDLKLHVPQVGWNTINYSQGSCWKDTILNGISEGEYMYFVHSYYAVPKFIENSLCTTNYGGIDYCSAVIKNNVSATQFHPEKSGEKGLLIYKNWLNKI
jgi:imidazole glycerol-phosphate synthase subunit HisH